MGKYVVRRLLLGAVTAVGVSLMVFALMRIAPGDVAMMIVESQAGEYWTQEQYEAIKLELGLDVPLPEQYFGWLGGMMMFDWGTSLYTGEDVWEAFTDKFPVTMQLAFFTVLLSVIIGIPLGVIMALKQDTWIDYVVRIVSLAGLSIPGFWLGTLLIVAGLYFFRWSPSIVYIPPFTTDKWGDGNLWGNFVQFIWPCLIGGYVSMATKSRMMRSTMLEVLRQDYIRTAHSKGLRSFIVVYRHALKNALIPVITVIGITIAFTIGGSVITERVFILPGVGNMMVTAMSNRDFPIVQSLVLFFAMWIVLTNLLVDLSYGWLDPRIRYE